MSDPILTKVCSKCQVEKPVTEFSEIKRRRRSNYRTGACKLCLKERQDAYLRRYWASPHGRAVTLWHAMNQRVNSDDKTNACYRDVEIRFTRDEFLAWLTPELEAWFRDRPGETPSVDRLDSTKHYEIGNVQVISREENSAKVPNVNDDAPDGHRWCKRCEQFLPMDRFFKRPTYCKLCTFAYKKDLNSRDPLWKSKQSAHQAVHVAVRKGRLVKPPHCQHPGCVTTKIDAHHHRGYGRAFWLDVVWLCRPHHSAAERVK